MTVLIIGFSYFIVITYYVQSPRTSADKRANFFVDGHGLMCYDEETDLIEFNCVKSDFTLALTYYYFTLTSFSTVGFGDYAPVSNFERPLGAVFLLLGVNIFSFYMNVYGEILEDFGKLDVDFDDSDELNKFWVTIDKFNHRLSIDKDLKERITNFLKYCWVNDRNNFLKTESDEYHLD